MTKKKKRLVYIVYTNKQYSAVLQKIKGKQRLSQRSIQTLDTANSFLEWFNSLKLPPLCHCAFLSQQNYKAVRMKESARFHVFFVICIGSIQWVRQAM